MMMHASAENNALFITGAGTEIGKTYVACAILRDLKARGIERDVLKPVLSGYVESEAEGSDAGLLLRALGLEPSIEAIERVSPWRFKAPIAPHMAAQAEGRALPYHDVVMHCRKRIVETNGAILIEGAGGVMAPLGEWVTNLDLIATIGASAVFVAGTYLGAVSHALTGLAVLDARGIVVKTVIVNESTESVGLEATMAMIAPHLTGVPMIAMQRGQEMLRLPD
jgi:dethiobiotin synthetase